MNYLIYIERAAENLQFFLWLQSYIKRFEALPESQKGLAPVIDLEKLEQDQQARPKSSHGMSRTNRDAAAIFKGTDFAGNGVAVHENSVNPFDEDDSSMGEKHGPISPWAEDASTIQSSKRSTFQQTAAAAYEAADIKLQPCKVPEPLVSMRF